MYYDNEAKHTFAYDNNNVITQFFPVCVIEIVLYTDDDGMYCHLRLLQEIYFFWFLHYI